jgi:hypothetical protein
MPPQYAPRLPPSNTPDGKIPRIDRVGEACTPTHPMTPATRSSDPFEKPWEPEPDALYPFAHE